MYCLNKHDIHCFLQVKKKVLGFLAFFFWALVGIIQVCFTSKE